MYSFVEELTEGLQEQELRDLVHTEIHIDEFQAKMGEDSDLVVVSFKVKYKQAAEDFEKFLEKGYDFILDAETSKAEYENGWYLVFVEMERRTRFPEQLLQVLEELRNITNVDTWRFKYGAARDNTTQDWQVTDENLRRIIPLSPKKYKEMFDAEQEHTDELDAMLMAANVNLNKNIELNEYTEALRIAAGLPVNGYKKTHGRPKRGRGR